MSQPFQVLSLLGEYVSDGQTYGSLLLVEKAIGPYITAYRELAAEKEMQSFLGPMYNELKARGHMALLLFDMGLGDLPMTNIVNLFKDSSTRIGIMLSFFRNIVNRSYMHLHDISYTKNIIYPIVTMDPQYAYIWADMMSVLHNHHRTLKRTHQQFHSILIITTIAKEMIIRNNNLGIISSAFVESTLAKVNECIDSLEKFKSPRTRTLAHFREVQAALGTLDPLKAVVYERSDAPPQVGKARLTVH